VAAQGRQGVCAGRVLTRGQGQGNTVSRGSGGEAGRSWASRPRVCLGKTCGSKE